MDSEVIGGRTLRNRRSLATKREEEKENALPKATRTPAKTPARRKKAQSTSETPLAKPNKKTFATLKVRKFCFLRYLKFYCLLRGFLDGIPKK